MLCFSKTPALNALARRVLALHMLPDWEEGLNLSLPVPVCKVGMEASIPEHLNHELHRPAAHRSGAVPRPASSRMNERTPFRWLTGACRSLR